MLITGCINCKSNKERKMEYKRLKKELINKSECEIYYEKNNIIYQYQSTRKQMFTI